MAKVSVSRGGVKREFTVDFWNSLPAGKYGWKKLAEVPEEVKALRDAKTETADDQDTTEVVETKALKTPKKRGKNAKD